MAYLETHTIRLLWLALAALIAGVLNAMAGGGSFVSFPALLGTGILPVEANATNTVALWPGQLVSILAMRADLERRLLPAAVLAAIIGGFGGAELLLHTAQRTFLALIPWLILVGTVMFWLSTPVSRWLQARVGKRETIISRASVFVALLPVAVYVGYFGAGAGFMVMTAMSLLGMQNIHRANAMKVTTVGMANSIAAVMFIASGAVVWRACAVAGIFAMCGGWLGARWARRVKPNVLRAIVIVVGCGMAAFFFWQNHQTAKMSSADHLQVSRSVPR